MKASKPGQEHDGPEGLNRSANIAVGAENPVYHAPCSGLSILASGLFGAYSVFTIWPLTGLTSSSTSLPPA